MIRLATPRIWVGDTGPLMQEIVQASRLDRLTSILAALHHDSARLYVAGHVLVEVERDLPTYSTGRGMDPKRALAWWHGYYLPYIRVVNVPENWGTEDPRVQGVANRHSVDLPTARLAAALAPCHGLIEDADLADHGFGRQSRKAKQSQSDWLKLAHGSANQAQIEIIGSAVAAPATVSLELARGAGRAFRRMPEWGQAVILMAGFAGAVAWHRSERAKTQLSRVGVALRDVGQAVSPVAKAILDRRTEAERVWLENVVAVGPVGLSERIARVLAVTNRAMTVIELAQAVPKAGALREHETAIRRELRDSTAFTEVSRGRWELGEQASDCEPGVDTKHVLDWLRRSHNRTPKLPKSS